MYVKEGNAFLKNKELFEKKSNSYKKQNQSIAKVLVESSKPLQHGHCGLITHNLRCRAQVTHL